MTGADSGRYSGLSIGEYLIRRLQDHGLRDLFGIPGDYILTFYSMLENSPINVVGCTREDCAGFAADAYARLNGLGAVCVTYCVGGLSVCNSIAGAYAEKSPVVVISGSPGVSERVNNPLLHHKVRDFRTQLDVFDKLCVAAAELTDPLRAFGEIDRVLDAAIRYKRPVYIELPRDMVNVRPLVAHVFREPAPATDAAALAEAVAETTRLWEAAERPLILAGVEIHRFGLQDQVLRLAEETGTPIAATLLGKSVVSERHPLFVGLYEGAMGRAEVTEYVEQSDLVLLLGTFMTDLNLGIFTVNLDPNRCVYATSEQLRIKNHHYHDVPLDAFLAELVRGRPGRVQRPIPDVLRPRIEPYELRADDPLTISRMILRLNQQLDDRCIVVADIGDSLFAATELVTHGRTDFISPAYYTSMGFSVPAALGAQVARPEDRVIAIVGDGAFQMTGQELSTLIRRRYPTVIILLDNHGYGTERLLHPGDWRFNEIPRWDYSRLPEVLGGARGHRVSTEGEFDAALRAAWESDGPTLIHVLVPECDCSPTLRRLGERLAPRVAGH